MSRNFARLVGGQVGRASGPVAVRSARQFTIRASTSRWAKTPENFEGVMSWFMQAAIEGGFKNVEFTMTTPGCLDCVTNFRKKYDGTALIGCGTCMNIEDVQNALEAGAQFIVSPILVPEVVKWCRERNVVCLPGCSTPTEMYHAYLYGAPIQKLFPGVVGGPNWVKAVSAAMPMLSINPTSGVDLDNAGEFLRSGASGVGLVAPLFDPADIASKNWDSIRAKAEKVMANVRACGPYVRN